MARNRERYVDTSAFIAALDRSDAHHGLFGRLFDDPPPLITSALVVVEGHGWLLRRYGESRSTQFLDFVDTLTCLSVVAFGVEELGSSGRLFRKFADQKITLVDAHGLSIMKDRGIDECWSTDRHLTLTGARLAIRGAR